MGIINRKAGFTQRGFGRIDFVDRYSQSCSIQESSLASERAIWFGVNDAVPQVLVSGQGWTKVEFPEGTLFSTRMHLTQEQINELLPILQYFADHGELLK